MADREMEITALLKEWAGGRRESREDLIETVYEELRRISQRLLARERANHTLQPTEVVSEAYLRLTELQRVSWEGRRQFFGFAAKLMRDVLVEHARSKGALKRGGDRLVIPLEILDEVPAEPDADRFFSVLDIDNALERLSEIDTRLVQLVELRFFGGLTEEEAAQVLGVSRATVQRDWAFAKRWLSRELEGS